MDILEFSKGEFLGAIFLYVFLLFLSFEFFHQLQRTFIDIWE